MKHSVWSQKRFYNECPLAVKKMKAIDLLSSALARGIEANEVDILSDKDQEGYIKYLPNPGEFVALVADNSTQPKPTAVIRRPQNHISCRFQQARTWTIQAQCREKLQGGCGCTDLSYRCCLRTFEWGLQTQDAQDRHS